MGVGSATATMLHPKGNQNATAFYLIVTKSFSTIPFFPVFVEVDIFLILNAVHV